MPFVVKYEVDGFGPAGTPLGEHQAGPFAHAAEAEEHRRDIAGYEGIVNCRVEPYVVPVEPPSEQANASMFLDREFGPLTLARALSAIRVTEEISLTQFAKRIGVSVQHLSDVEKGRRRVSVERAAKWAKRLGYPPIMFVKLVLQEEVTAAGLKLRVDVVAA